MITAKEKVKSTNIKLQRRSDLCIPRNEPSQPCSQFPHSCICERFIYSQYRSPFFLQHNRKTDSGNMLIAHKNMNVDIGNEKILHLGFSNLKE